jgi:membrane protein YqaA with SNARE-associated domain
MFRRYVFSWVHEIVERNAARRCYAPLVGLLALGATLTMSIPFLPVLIAAVLLNPVRWRHIVLWSALGSASAALLLLIAFHHPAEQIAAWFPQIETTQWWIVVSGWLEEYHLIALFVVATSPLPLIPALIFAAILALPPAGIFAAILAAKLVQYGLVAWVVARFPQRFARRSDAIPL